MNCSTIKPVIGCWKKADGSFESVSIHYEYAYAASGKPIVVSTRYTKADGGDIITIPVGDTVTLGACQQMQTSTEVGCMSSPGTADFTNVVRCKLAAVEYDGKLIPISLDAGWTVAQLVSAVNAVQPNTISQNGNSIVVSNGKPFANFRLGCVSETCDFEFVETFENPVRTNTATDTNPGNNIIGPMIGNWRSQNGNSLNIVRSDGVAHPLAAGIGPITGPSGGVQYLDVVGDDYPVYPFSFVNSGQVEVSAYLGNRSANAVGYVPWTGQVEILDANTLAIVASGNAVSFTSSVPVTQWFQSSITTSLPAGDYLFRVFLGNFGHMDDVRICTRPIQWAESNFQAKGSLESVEIVKLINSNNGQIVSLKVYSPDGTRELTMPDPNGRVLSTGACPMPSTTTTVAPSVVNVLAGSLGVIAGATRSATAEFTGAPATVDTAGIVGKLQSITVTASGIVDGTTSTDSVTVTLPSGVPLRLFDGQPFTWSVARNQDGEVLKPISITASGNAYANVGYTTI
jgi:hypothetical protein